MATRAASLPNSLTGQIEFLSQEFSVVEEAAKIFEVHQVRSISLLHDALAKIYEFGLRIFDMPSAEGRSVVEEFLIDNKVSFNVRVRTNPYIGLVKLAFKGSSDSSRSQYSTVLNHACNSEIKADAFKAWIAVGGVEGRRDEAVAAGNSTARQQHNRRKATLAARARITLSVREASEPVTLPAHIKAPEGFAIFLARVDGSNTAQIIDLIEADAEKVDAQLIALAKEEAQPITLFGPLGSFFRALDLIAKVTPKKIDGQPRDILIINTLERGSPVAFVAATSQARSFPSARIKLVGHVGQLPQDQPFILKADHADFLLSLYSRHEDWAISDVGGISGGGLTQPIYLHHLTDAGAYRVASIPTPSTKLFTVTAEQMNDVATYIRQEREGHARRNESRKEKIQFSSSAALGCADGQMFIRLLQSVRTATLAQAESNFDLSDVALLTNEVEAIAAALASHDLQVNGAVIDTDVDNAAILFETMLDEDRLRIVLPTRVGGNYNQVCEGVNV